MSEKNQKDSNYDSSSKRKTREEKESGRSTLGKTEHCFKNKMASGSKDICSCSIEEKDKHPKKQGSDFHYSSEKYEEDDVCVIGQAVFLRFYIKIIIQVSAIQT